MNDSCLVMIAHGSKNPLWREPFEQLLKDLRNAGGNDNVYLSYMQLAQPSLEEIIEQVTAAGKHRIRILPMLMAGGNHFHEDIPLEIARLRAKHPGMQIELMPPIGCHPRFIAMMQELVKECNQ